MTQISCAGQRPQARCALRADEEDAVLSKKFPHVKTKLVNNKNVNYDWPDRKVENNRDSEEGGGFVPHGRAGLLVFWFNQHQFLQFFLSHWHSLP